MVLHAVEIDPRDETWESYHPDYRVYFWDTNAASHEWELTECDDLDEVRRWAEDRAQGRTFTLYAVVRQLGEVGLVRLLGTDPTKT